MEAQLYEALKELVEGRDPEALESARTVLALYENYHNTPEALRIEQENDNT